MFFRCSFDQNRNSVIENSVFGFVVGASLRIHMSFKDTVVKMNRPNVSLLRKGSLRAKGQVITSMVAAGCTQRVIKRIEIADWTPILELRATKQFINEMMGLTNWTRVKKFQKRCSNRKPLKPVEIFRFEILLRSYCNALFQIMGHFWIFGIIATPESPDSGLLSYPE